MLNVKKLTGIAETFADDMVKIRRDFHRHPETAWQEFRTTARIAELMEQAGYTVLMGPEVINQEQTFCYPDQEVIHAAMSRARSEGANPTYLERTQGYTGLCAQLDTKRPGPIIAYRFDIDCNDVTESCQPTHRPFACGFSSLHPLEMHACGHDGHAAMGIGLAWTLMELKEELNGVIRIFFQPAEEGVRGARSMATSGLLDDVDYLFTGHIGFSARKNNQVFPGVKGILGTSKFNAYITGAAAHAGASPHDGKNAVLAAASAILNMHAMCQDGRGASRVNVGVVAAGSGRNVVADSATLKVETRGETSAINERMQECALSAIAHSCAMYGCTYRVYHTGNAKGLDSSEPLTTLVGDMAKLVLGDVEVQGGIYLGCSDDATHLMEAVASHGGQAIYSMFGSELAAPHHAATFDFDESVLVRGAKVHAACALHLCQQGI